jgi:RHH-type proline utilization regulon transcriptional repressor/proline dehydrogenase/delta 1-pyrroline-5-carboxylate dehydrogenase
MDWSMKDQDFKVQLFRFVDAFPVLTTPEMVHEHLMDYLTQPGVKLPPGMDLRSQDGRDGQGPDHQDHRGQIRGWPEVHRGHRRGERPPGLKKLWDQGIAFSVDLLGEACVSDAEADAYRTSTSTWSPTCPTRRVWKPDTPCSSATTSGVVPRTNVSIKISSLSAKYDPIDPDGAIEDAMKRLLPSSRPPANTGRASSTSTPSRRTSRT